MSTAKVPLEQGLPTSAREGTPLSAKFEIVHGTFQLSVWTARTLCSARSSSITRAASWPRWERSPRATTSARPSPQREAIGREALASGTTAVVEHSVNFSKRLARVGPARGGGARRRRLCAEVFRMATEGGARVLGVPALGRLAPGWLADIVAVRVADNLFLTPLGDPLETLVYAASGGRDVVMTMVDGEIIYHAGRFLIIDAPSVLATVQASGARLRAPTATTTGAPE